MKKLSILTCFCLLFLFSVFADWNPGDPYKMHHPQLPDPEGWDVCLCCQWIADDFVCTETGPITDIHFWISWNEDRIGDLTAQNLDVSIWNDMLGMPGAPIWHFTGGNVVIRPYGQGLQGWVCPSPPPYVAPNNHSQYFQVNMTQLNEPIRQIEGNTYWLVIRVNLTSPPWPEGPAVGWKTSQTRFQSPSLWSIDGTVWQPVNTAGVNIWDQAFVITSEEKKLDFGDAPDQPYPTLLANNGARHIITAVGPWLGDASDSPDAEADGQQTLNADGDDNDGNDDEDGVQIPLLTIGQPATITFQVSSGDGLGGIVSGWIDYNGNGSWGDIAAEQIVNGGYADGSYAVTITPPPGSVVGNTYARFRISRGTMIPLPTGLAQEGEVEDYLVTIKEEIPQFEFGDAPEGGLAYPAAGVIGQFPTCITVGPALWIQHSNFGAWFGPAFDFEMDGNAGLCPACFPPYDQDETFMDGDAGLLFPNPFTIDNALNVVPCAPGPGTALGQVCQAANWGVDIDIQVSNFMPNQSTAFVNLLIDWDQNGQWGGSSSCSLLPAPEHVLVDFPVPPGFAGPLSALMPPGFIIGPNPGYVWARFSITEKPVGVSGAPWTGEGIFEDGETEDYLLKVDSPLLLDFGDAPDQPYPTLLASNGARHIIRTIGPWLGDATDNPDQEADGQPTASADGDDNDGNDDEDGVQIPPIMNIGQMSTITFQVSSGDGAGGMVSGWIDFNGNGSWGDAANEQIVSGNYVDGVYNVNVIPQIGSVIGPTYVRFRISRDLSGTVPVGLARDGEVEDYLVKIGPEIIEEELKFQQLPLNGQQYFGHDELSTVYPVYDPTGTEPKIIEYRGCYMADDFADLAYSPVIRVKWWGSYLGNEIVQPVLSFMIAFESDVPAITDPIYIPSHPGVLLSQEEVFRDMDGMLVPGEFREIQVGPGGPPCFETLYQYEALLVNPFPQHPNTVYWLKIAAVVELPSGHTLWQDAAQWPGGDICDYLVNGYGHLPQFYPVTRWGWHNRDYTKVDPYASRPPAVRPGEHLAGIIPDPTGLPLEVWHFQDDAVAGHVHMPVDPSIDPRKIIDVIQPDWLEQYYKFMLPYCVSPAVMGVDGPEEIVTFSKDLAFELWTSPETITVPGTPTGPSSGYITVVYTFSTTGSVSSLGHVVEYRFNWGNGKYSAWSTSLSASTLGGAFPTYTTGGTYNITVEARCQAHPTITAVSAPYAFLVQECQFYNLTKKVTTFPPVGTDNVVNATDVSKIITYINSYAVSSSIWVVLPTNPNYMEGFNLSPAVAAINASDVSALINYINTYKISTSVWVANCASLP